jgi:hypothetical protein
MNDNLGYKKERICTDAMELNYNIKYIVKIICKSELKFSKNSMSLSGRYKDLGTTCTSETSVDF